MPPHSPLTVGYIREGKFNACKCVRVHEPLETLAADGRLRLVDLESLVRPEGQALAISSAGLSALDLLFLHLTDVNPANLPAFRTIFDQLEFRGRHLALTLDDHYFLSAPDSSHEHLKIVGGISASLSAYREVLARAAVVFVTVEDLGRVIAPFTREVVVVPNLIRPTDYPVRPKRGRRRLHLGWAGSVTHFEDLTSILPAVRRVQRQHPVRFTIFGLSPTSIVPLTRRVQQTAAAVKPNAAGLNPYESAVVELSQGLAGIAYRFVSLVSYPVFPLTLASLEFDIGLCPLADTPFNRCRSALKFYQYAAAGAVTLASDVPPYRGECDCLAANTEDGWYEGISRLVEDPQDRERHAISQRAFVSTQRTYEVGVHRYLDAFQRVAAAGRVLR